ncbi:MAG: putative DNA binding domain-containing protein, partial [Prevotella sp.]|nr:putative DNA binding domain-containing protein [Prevotella sp.]
MTEQELQQYLLSNYPKENEGCEWKEFKSLKNDFNGKEKDDVISYVSALANMEGGHMVIGVVDKTLEIVGTDTYNYDLEKARLRLVSQCANLPSEGLSVEEFITDDTHKTVWVIHVPRHMMRRPVYAHNKAWQRLDDSLVEITDSRLDAILNEKLNVYDWSAEIVSDATIEDLDPRAIRLARTKFVELYPHREDECRMWDNETFLNKAKITIGGKITRAAIILLGRDESEHFLSPAVCKIRWQLRERGRDGNKDFRILSIPMILALEELTSLVRNTTYTYTIEGNPFPMPLPRYDIFTIREPVCNMIAHQSYESGARMEVVEWEDEKLMFRNYGTFIPNSIEQVIRNNYPESNYRYPFLVEAMRNIKMVETEGGGILKLFNEQRKRLFPMPTYDMSDGMVAVEIDGRMLSTTYAQILLKHPELDASQIYMLDRVAKGLPLPERQTSELLAMGLVVRKDVTLELAPIATPKHINTSDQTETKAPLENTPYDTPNVGS